MQFEPTAFVKMKYYTCIFIRTTGEIESGALINDE